MSVEAEMDERIKASLRRVLLGCGADKPKAGRPVTRPPCRTVTYKLPIDLLDRVQAAAYKETGGNATLLVERFILSGLESLE